MKLHIDKEWGRRFDGLDDAEVEAGLPLGSENVAINPRAAKPEPVFNLFVRQLRRRHGLTIHQMASLAEITEDEVRRIEREPGHTPEKPAMRRLADLAGVQQDVLALLPQVDHAPDQQFQKAAFTFFSRSEQGAELTGEEQEAFDEYIRYLKGAPDEKAKKPGLDG